MVTSISGRQWVGRSPKVFDVFNDLSREIKRPALDLVRSRGRGRRKDDLLGAHNQEPFKSVAAQPGQLALEPRTRVAGTAADQIRDALALHAEEIFEPGNRVVAGRQGAANRFQPGEDQRVLFASVANN
jgi:hypothetical protein